MRTYVASSWRNRVIDQVIPALRGAGHEVYDFREDDEDGAGFNWSDIDPNWKTWSPVEFRKNLLHPIASAGFTRDMIALRNAEALLLVLPCGRSAHLELGYAIGAGKSTAVLLADGQEPELMYRAVDELLLDVDEMLECFRYFDERRGDVGRLFKSEAGKISKVRPA